MAALPTISPLATPMEAEGPDLAAATTLKEEGTAHFKKSEWKAAVASFSSALSKLAESEAKLRTLQGEELALCVGC